MELNWYRRDGAGALTNLQEQRQGRSESGDAIASGGARGRMTSHFVFQQLTIDRCPKIRFCRCGRHIVRATEVGSLLASITWTNVSTDMQKT